MNNKILIPSMLSLLLLQACGGGGGGGSGAALDAAAPPAAEAPPSAPPGTPTSGDSGAVSARFVPGADARYQFFGTGQSFGPLTQSEQAPSGAMVRLGDIVLSGATATKEIGGDASFAIGRWVAGTVTQRSGAETLTGTDHRAYHYLAFNRLPVLPTTGSATCDAGVFTAPTFTDGPSGAGKNSGTTSGSANITFSADGAVFSGMLSMVAEGGTGTATLNTTAGSPTSVAISGALFSGGSGAAIQLGDHGGGAYAMAVGYAIKLPSGARYTGVAKFRCV